MATWIFVICADTAIISDPRQQKLGRNRQYAIVLDHRHFRGVDLVVGHGDIEIHEFAGIAKPLCMLTTFENRSRITRSPSKTRLA